MKRLLSVAGILSIFITAPLFALDVPEKPQAYVNDYASLLSVEARRELEDKLAAFEKETSNQVLVALFPSLEGDVLEDFSIRLAEKWKAGAKEKDNGVILMVFRDDRAVRIEVGYGLEGALPDATARMIIENEIVPAFRQGDFDAGVGSAVNAILQAAAGEYKPSSGKTDEFAEKYAPWVFFAMAGYFIFPLICYFLVTVFFVSLFGLPGFFLGVLLSIVLDFFRRIYLAPLRGTTFTGGSSHWGGSGGGFSSGGFGGGGGGSFGGGGASGRW